MPNIVFNTGLGRVAALHDRVDGNDPAASALIVVAINTTATDVTLKRLATLAAIEADANTAEVTNVGYARKVLTDTDITAAVVNNTNDRVECDIADQTWTSVAAAGGAWTDLIICYDADTAAGTDANIIPLTLHDFAVTPNGGNVVAQVADYYRAS